MCAAPGGFLATALRFNPKGRFLAFSLPEAMGGHKVQLQRRPNVKLRFMDITMLAADMGVTDIPAEHPDAANFLPRKFTDGQVFDLILCDGQVLRTHARASYREKREARRLIVTQLALALEHVRPGGTMVVLLHRVESWETVSLLHTFSKFSSIQLFKSQNAHATRSSFYMVTTNIQRRHPDAMSAVEGWKTVWKIATFGTDEEYWKMICESESRVGAVLEEFGPQLIELGRDIWGIQARALARAPWLNSKESQ